MEMSFCTEFESSYAGAKWNLPEMYEGTKSDEKLDTDGRVDLFWRGRPVSMTYTGDRFRFTCAENDHLDMLTPWRGRLNVEMKIGME